jgi:hypothetical protein
MRSEAHVEAGSCLGNFRPHSSRRKDFNNRLDREEIYATRVAIAERAKLNGHSKPRVDITELSYGTRPRESQTSQARSVTPSVAMNSPRPTTQSHSPLVGAQWRAAHAAPYKAAEQNCRMAPAKSEALVCALQQCVHRCALCVWSDHRVSANACSMVANQPTE